MITLTLAMDRAAGTGTAAIKEDDVGTIFDFSFPPDALVGGATDAVIGAFSSLEEILANPPDGKTVIARPATSTTSAKPAKKADATKPKGKAAVDSDGFTLIDMFAVPATTTPAPATATATVDEDIFAIDF